jgi:hypothetical protein
LTWHQCGIGWWVEGTFGQMIRVLDKQIIKDLDGIMILIQKTRCQAGFWRSPFSEMPLPVTIT